MGASERSVAKTVGLTYSLLFENTYPPGASAKHSARKSKDSRQSKTLQTLSLADKMLAS
jgi:hypothetical protein